MAYKYKIGDKVRLKGTKSTRFRSYTWEEVQSYRPNIFKKGNIVTIQNINSFNKEYITYTFLEEQAFNFLEQDFELASFIPIEDYVKQLNEALKK